MLHSYLKNLMNIAFLKLSATLLTWLSAVVCIRFAGMILVMLIGDAHAILELYIYIYILQKIWK